MKHLWIKVTVSVMLVVVVGVGAYVMVDRLSATAVNVLVGGVLTLGIVVVVGALFVGYGLVQSYVMRRMVRDDDMSDLRQMAMLSSIMRGGRDGPVRIRMPDQSPMLGPGRQAFDGAYRDTTASQEIEVE